MRNIQILNRALWGLNGLLGVGIISFAWLVLFSGRRPSGLSGIQWDDEAIRPPAAPSVQDDSILKTLRNPIKKEELAVVSAPPLRFKAVLKGTFSSDTNPNRGIAFIRSTTRNVELVTFVDEEIEEGGRPSEEFRGWKLAEVAKGQAIFTDGKIRLSLALNQEAPSQDPVAPPEYVPSRPKVDRIGQPYQSLNFRSQLLASADNRVIWGLDLDEIDWAAQNQESILDHSLSISPTPSGGLRLDNLRAGSIGASRGLLQGDVLREVNGQPIRTLEEARSLLATGAFRTSSALRLGVERAGKPVVIEYRPLPQ